MLHPGIRSHDEEARQPGAEAEEHAHRPVPAGAKALLPIEQESQAGGLQEEREDTFHGQGLPDDPTRCLRERRPIGAELELHRDACNHAHGKVDGEDVRPETRRPVVVRASCPERRRLQQHDEERQTNGELRKEVVVDDGQGKVQAVHVQCGVHTVHLLCRACVSCLDGVPEVLLIMIFAQRYQAVESMCQHM